jgi:tetratricopeptide (TPR) repeat protein
VDPNEYRYYSYCMSNNKPYFGKVMWALQGDPIRHAYMQCLVQAQCRDRGEKPFHILEIGSWAGGSAITWAEAIKKWNKGKGRVVCIDPWKSYFDPSRYSGLPQDQQGVYHEMAEALSTGKIFDLFLHNIRVSAHEDSVLPVKGASDVILPLFGEGRFDLIFIDGDHTYPRVLGDIRKSAPLVGEGGILCGDDLELQLSQIDRNHAELNKHMDYILDPKAKVNFHPGVSLAVGEFFGEVSAWEGLWAMRKRGEGWEKVDVPMPLPGELHLPEHLSRGTFLEETKPMNDQVSLQGTTNSDFAQGLALVRAGRLQEAVPVLLRAIEQSPRDPAIYNHLGVVLHKLGNKAGAEKNFRTAIREGPDNVDAWASLAEICCEQGRYREGLEYLKEAASLDPRDAGVVTALGTLGLNLKDEEAIRLSLQCITETEPNHALIQALHRALGESPVRTEGTV